MNSSRRPNPLFQERPRLAIAFGCVMLGLTLLTWLVVPSSTVLDRLAPAAVGILFIVGGVRQRGRKQKR
jgi:hypothetical protein